MIVHNFVKQQTHYILTLDLKQRNKHLRNIFDIQSQAIYIDNLFFKKRLHILENNASSVQVGIHDNCLNFVLNMINFIEFMLSQAL